MRGRLSKGGPCLGDEGGGQGAKLLRGDILAEMLVLGHQRLGLLLLNADRDDLVLEGAVLRGPFGTERAAELKPPATPVIGLSNLGSRESFKMCTPSQKLQYCVA
jgi:hypothetical protein